MIAAVGKVYEWEGLKLLAQKRTYLGRSSAILVPIVFVVVLVLQTGGPNDVPLGRYIRDTGLAAPVALPLFHLTASPPPRPGLSRQGPRGAHVPLRGRLRPRSRRPRRRQHRLGLPPTDLALGDEGFGGRRPGGAPRPPGVVFSPARPGWR